jgi:hypothetical protein
VVKYLAGGCKDDGAPSLAETVRFIDNLDNFGFEFLLCGEAAVPEVIANGALLQKSLESLLVLADADETADVRDSATEECCLEDALWDGGILLLEEGDVEVAFRMGGVPGLPCSASYPGREVANRAGG